MANDKLKEALRESAMEEFKNIQSETIIWEPSDDFTNEMDALLDGKPVRRKSVLKRGLLIAAVILLISLTTISAFGIRYMKNNNIGYFSKSKGDHVEIAYGYEESGDITVYDMINHVFTLGKLPEGYKQTSFKSSPHNITTVWENDEGDSIILQQGDGITKRSIDNERLKKSHVAVNGVTMDVYSEEGYSLILWNSDVYTFSIDYYGSEDPEKVAVFIAENLKLKGEDETPSEAF